MDYNQQDSDQSYLPEKMHERPFPEAPNGMARAAFVCGILSLIGIFFNASIFFGAFAIMFALLSRRKRMSRQARVGMRMGIIGVTIAGLVIGASIGILASSGLLGKYAKRIAEIDPENPTAVTQLENDLINDLAKTYGIDPSSLRESGNGNSPLDPTIENDNRDAGSEASEDSSAESSESGSSDSSSSGNSGSDSESRSESDKSGQGGPLDLNDPSGQEIL